MKKRIQDFRVIENRRLNTEYFELVLASGTDLPAIHPGQFAELRVDHCPDAFLRRPVSFYDVDRDRNQIRLLIRIAGKGTTALSLLDRDARVNLIYPLGKPFPMENVDHALLIGGGVGVAPLLFLGHRLSDLGKKVSFLLGFRTAGLVVDLKEFKRYGRVYLTTDDGSAGEKGVVTGHSLLKRKPGAEMVYTCGPVVMMKAVADYADSAGLECQASLENTMACGFGACLCCTQATIRGNLCVCTEGPVFNTKELIWQI